MPSSRRGLLKVIAGGGIAGLGGVAVLSGIATQRVSADTSLTFPDKTVTIKSREPADDVIIGGEVQGEFDATETDVSVDALAFNLTFNWRGGVVHKDTIEVTDVDPKRDSVTVTPTYSMIDDMEFEPAYLGPYDDSGDSNRKHTFPVTVDMLVRSGDEVVKRATASAEGRLVLLFRPETSGSISVVSPGGEFTFTVKHPDKTDS